LLVVAQWILGWLVMQVRAWAYSGFVCDGGVSRSDSLERLRRASRRNRGAAGAAPTVAVLGGMSTDFDIRSDAGSDSTKGWHGKGPH